MVKGEWHRLFSVDGLDAVQDGDLVFVDEDLEIWFFRWDGNACSFAGVVCPAFETSGDLRVIDSELLERDVALNEVILECLAVGCRDVVFDERFGGEGVFL